MAICIDVLLYLIKFVNPVDRFNLVLSGILKGFENANEGIDLRKRYSEHFNCSVSSNDKMDSILFWFKLILIYLLFRSQKIFFDYIIVFYVVVAFSRLFGKAKTRLL